MGSTKPRIYTPPLVRGRKGPCGCGCALSPETSKGFSAVEFARDVLGVELIPWQRWLLIHALELNDEGLFRFRTILIMVARQNGKTTLVEVKNLWKMFVLRVPMVIGTAQNLDISEESWSKAVEIVESVPDLRAEVAHVDKTNGKKALKLINGSRWKIAAASRRGGRGLSGDDVNLDELREHQNWDSWGAVTKTTIARRNSQVWAFSNAGDDKSLVLIDLQRRARESVQDPAADPSLGLFEWSVPDDTRCTCARRPHVKWCQLQDRELWAMANPSLGYLITEEALASALATDPEQIFRTECLCQHVVALEPDWRVIAEADWRAAADPTQERDGRPAFCIDMSPDREWSVIGAAWFRPDGLRQIEVIDVRPGTGWLQGRVVELQAHQPCAWVIPRDSPAASELPWFEETGVEVLRMSGPDAVAGAGLLYDGVAGRVPDEVDVVSPRTVRHCGQEQLDLAVAKAARRPPEDRAWLWDRARPHAYMLIAVTGALWGLATRGYVQDQPFFAMWR